ncbi:hypothetical protein EDD65_10687 [Keratinibaculum paraultunense]|uniref:Uncharacterized protein n=1 Tax=Keratinibaculum paraultunense TaxID=1278232 RepID=A0A4R3KV68_9FIRM|nr:hypothetical protein EDD65_10687 [Keratinibaculum paraultunense]
MNIINKFLNIIDFLINDDTIVSIYYIFYLECCWMSISRGQISNQRKGGFYEDYTYDR